MAEGDRRLLRLALENLLGNAFEFTSKEPEARIEFGVTDGEDGAPAYYVRDNGVGFDQAYAASSSARSTGYTARTSSTAWGSASRRWRAARRHGGRV